MDAKQQVQHAREVVSSYSLVVVVAAAAVRICVSNVSCRCVLSLFTTTFILSLLI